MKKIVIDTYGADAGIAPIVDGAISVLENYPDIAVILTGNKAEIEKIIGNNAIDRLSILHTEDVIKSTDAPNVIVGDNHSSMALALDTLKNDDECAGLLSAGNTGALLVGSIFRLGLVKGLRVPALSSGIPTAFGTFTCLVDCGANLNCTAKDFALYALMGDAFLKSLYPDRIPRVGILSVGRESTKGNAVIQKAHPILEKLPINFIGNVEGCDLSLANADVIVSDGFNGNIMLKCVEATGKAAMKLVDDMASLHPENKELLSELRENMSKIFDLNLRGGATFLGTKKPVIKMHGIATAQTVLSCVDQLIRIDRAGFSQKVAQAIENFKI